jgi:hypothetical protein
MIPPTHEGVEIGLKTVARSKYVLLLQTERVLWEPWALLATYRARLANVPVVCVMVERAGYDFGGVVQHLEHLDERLGAGALAHVASSLACFSPTQDVDGLKAGLASLVPNIISIVFDPDGSASQLAATARDIRDKHDALIRSPSSTRSRKRKEATVRSGWQRTRTLLRSTHAQGACQVRWRAAAARATSG